jgi:rhamnogalacturonan endolyase
MHSLVPNPTGLVSEISECRRRVRWKQLKPGLFFFAGMLLLANSVFANNPGGFTPLVTAAVTTGTESYNGHTDHFLDNGILHVSISPNGSVDSIKYLKPGSAGTPKANGVETVSQSGVNFGNHTAIYYYWYPDGNSGCVYSNTVVGGTNVDIGYLRAYNPAADSVVADVELHYVLGRGNTGLYAYLIVRHPASYASYGSDLGISFIQCLWPTAHDSVNFLCENSYVDDGVRYGLAINGVYQKRNGLQPNFYDNWHTIAVTNINIPKEVIQYTTGVFAGSTNGKYSYTFDYPKLGTFGMASDINHIGLWYVTGGHEYQNNGPTACEYSGGIGGLITFEPLIAHYGNTGLNVSSNADFAKIYGPWLFYINSGTNGAACWADSQRQVLAEEQAWPYAWLTNPVYQARNQRAIVSGKLVIHDPLRPEANAAGAWIGLAAPDASLENDPHDWQFQSDGYQFWTQCAADGTFTLPPVTTFSPYGTNATYELYAYCAGTNGSVGQFQTGPFRFAPGTVTNLGTLTWTVPHSGNSIAWEIGCPDRTAGEFLHGDDYSIPGLWLGFTNDFPNPMTYTVGESDWTKDWNYAQTAYFVNGVANNMVWNIRFNLPKLPLSGNLTLNTVWAGANHAAIQVFVNHPNGSGSVFRDFYPSVPNGANSVIREGIHDKYGVDHTVIPVSRFVAGTNTITLIQRRAATDSSCYVMYDYLDLELPTPAAPAGLAARPGDAQVGLSWAAAPGATGYYLRQSTQSGGPYQVIAANVSSLNFTQSGLSNGRWYYYTVTATNSAGESLGSDVVGARPTSAVMPPLVSKYDAGAGQLTLTWPADHIGWVLQMQTNTLATGLGTNWIMVPGSLNTNQIAVPVGSESGSVFFRLANQP